MAWYFAVFLLGFLTDVIGYNVRLPPGPGPIALGVALEGDMDTIIEDSKLEVLTTNMEWTEGPLWSQRGNFLLFADTNYDTLYRWEEGKGISVFANNSGSMGPALRFPSLAEHLKATPLEMGSAGMAWDSDQEEGLYICQLGARRVLHVRLLPDRSGLDLPTAQIVVDAWQGQNLNSPTDIMVFEGRVYFTDPPFGNQLESDTATHYECPLCAAYNRSTERVSGMFGIYMVSDPLGVKAVTRIAKLPGPNGIAVHAATRRMLIANTANSSWQQDPFWVLYDMYPNGTLKADAVRRIVYDNAWKAKYHKMTGVDLADSVEDFDGGFFVAGPSGVYAMTPDGDLIGRIKTYAPMSNMAKSPSHLYITVAKNVVRAKLRNITLDKQLQLSEDVATYDFTVSYFKMNPDGREYVYVQGINGQFPGPTIHVRQGQRLMVRVANRLKTEAVLIHWHGFEMRSSPADPLRPAYDGANGVSACEIPPGDTFIYDFVVDEHPGTYWYHDHGHPEHVGVRGLFGAIIVYPRNGMQDTHAALYDGNTSDEVLMLHDYWTRTTGELHIRSHGGFSRTPTRSVDQNNIGIITFESALINGRGWFQGLTDAFTAQCTRVCRQDSEWFDGAPLDSTLGDACINRCLRAPHYEKNRNVVEVSSGERIRLRIVNAASLFAFRFSIDGHSLKVISTDGADVEPLVVDALVISSGERYDVVVEAGQPVANYWIRVETLEESPHGTEAVLHYLGAGRAEPANDRCCKSPIVLNCVDLGPLSATCLPVTALRRHANQAPLYKLNEQRPNPHSFEVSWRGTAGLSPAHFVRILDLAHGEHNFESQYDGSYVQFAFPSNPPMYFGPNVTHENSATLRVEREEYVELILQQADRTAHPWHLHGHKFEVLSVGYPDYDKDCSIMACLHPWYRPRTHAHTLIDPAVAVLKDTVFIPAGGYAVIRFRADNPGWWLLHCHMHIHLHDGMALMIDEAGEEFYNYFAQQEQGLSTRCSHAMEGTLRRHWITHWRSSKTNKWMYDTPVKGDVLPVACDCWQDPDMVMNAGPFGNYRCAHYYLCHQMKNSLDPPANSILSSPIGLRDRKEGRPWRIGMACIALVLALVMLRVRIWIDSWRSRRAQIQIYGKRPPEIAPVLYCEKNTDVLTFSDVTVQAHNGTTVLHNIGGRVGAGEILGIMGPSGSGKTLLLDALGGRRQRVGLGLTTGEIFLGEQSLRAEHSALKKGGLVVDWFNERWSNEKEKIRQLRSYMTQELALQENLSVFEFLLFYARLRNKHCLGDDVLKQLVMSWITEITLDGSQNRKVGQLSIGQQRRVGIAMEMMFPTKLLILDEPLAGLDSAASAKVMLLLDGLSRDRRTTILLTVHTPGPNLLPVFDRMMLLQRGGRLFYDGPTSEVSNFFGSIGEPQPDSWNAADWWLDVITRWATEEASVPGISKPRSESLFKIKKTQEVTRTVIRNLGTESEHSITNQRRRGCGRIFGSFFSQAYVICEMEILNSMEGTINIFKLVEVFGLATVTGLVWFTRNSDNTMIGLRETVGLLFYTTAVWSIPPMFSALAGVPSLMHRVKIERFKGLYSLRALLAGQFFASQILTIPWPMFWVVTAYALADVSPSPGVMLVMCFVIYLHVTAVTSLATAIGVSIGHQQTSLIVVIIASQFSLVVNGFYTQLPDWLAWVSSLSPPRYTFQALLKLEYSWRDSFSVHPHLGWLSRGMPSTSIPAEMTITFQDMKRRGIEAMTSPEDASILTDLLALVVVIVVSRIILLLAMYLMLRRAEQRTKLQQDEVDLEVARMTTDLHQISLRKGVISVSCKDVKSLASSCSSWEDVKSLASEKICEEVETRTSI